MIKITSVSIQNFLSYGAVPTVINLDTKGTTLIVGEDLDNTASGTGANGVGKSVWLNALIYGLYGKPISNIKADNLVNNINNKHLEVIVEFVKDNKIFTVKRVRKEKGLGNYAKVFCRGVKETLNYDKHDVTPDSIKNIDSFVETALGIPFELFVRIVAFPATHTPFLDLPVRHASQANQSDIMEELFRLNRLSEKGDLLKIEIKDTKQSLDIKQRHNEQLEIEHDRHNTQVDSAVNRVVDWDNDHGIKITAAKKALLDFDDIDLDEQLELFTAYGKLYDASYDYNNKIKDLSATVKETNVRLDSVKYELDSLDAVNSNIRTNFKQWELDNTNAIKRHEDDLKSLVPRGTIEKQSELHNTISELNDDRGILIDETKKIDNDITLLIKVISDNESELSHLLAAKCPYCLQKYDNTETKIASCKAELHDTNEKLKTKNNSKVAYDEAFVLLDREIADARNQITHHPEEIQAEETLRTNLLSAMENFKNTTNPYKEQEEAIDETQCYEIQKKIEQHEKDIKRDKKKIQTLDDNYQGLLVNMSNAEKDIVFDSVDLVYEAKAKFELAQNNLETLKNTANPHTEALEELRAVVLEKIDMDGINKLDKLLTHQQYLQKLLTKKDSFIRKNLLSKNLIFLNQRLKGYLLELGLPHRVEFTQEMTAKISQFGRELDFGNLSSGQKARVNLGLSFSFRDVLQRSLDSVNVCMLDEVLDVGLDSVGIQAAAKMLKRKAREDELSLFIISHRDEINGIFDKKLIVQMSKGFSNIRLE